MKRQRSNSIDLFEQTNSAHSPARSVLSSSGAPRSDAGGGDGHSVGGGGGGAGGGGGGVVVDEATRQKILHAERMRWVLFGCWMDVMWGQVGLWGVGCVG